MIHGERGKTENADSELVSIGCLKCAEEHHQLAEWLFDRELKQLKKQKSCEDAISRQAVLKEIPKLWNSNGDKD